MNKELAGQNNGSRTAEIEVLIERVKTITPEQFDALYNAYDSLAAARFDELWNAWCAAESAVNCSGRTSLRWAVWYSAWNAVGTDKQDEDWYAIWYAILVLLVRDLITEDQFNALYDPWASVMGDNLNYSQSLSPDVAQLRTDLARSHSDETHSRQGSAEDSTLYCSCGQGPFSTDYAWALHQSGTRAGRIAVLEEQLMRSQNELEQLQEQIEKSQKKATSE
jgi:hypothetical protein